MILFYLLSSFIFNLPNLIPKFFFLISLNTHLLKWSLNQLYHLTDSFISDLNKSLTRLFYV